MSGSSPAISGTFSTQQMAAFSTTSPQQQQGHSLNKFQSIPGQTAVGHNLVGNSSSGTSGLSFPSMDLSGKLIIKVRIEGDDDVRRIPIHNEDITYDELLLMMQRVFVGKISSSDDVVVKYRDDDGDFITIADNPDLTVAKQASRILHLKLFVQGGRVFPRISGCTCDVQDVRQQLIKVRNHVNYLLDLIVPDSSVQSSGMPPTAAESDPQLAQDAGKPMGPADLSVAQKLFDPLKSQHEPPSTNGAGNTSMQAPVQSAGGSSSTPASMSSAPPATAATVTAASATAAPLSDVTNSATAAVADSFGLSADDMAAPPEQPNAPPSDAMNTTAYPMGIPQQQQPGLQQQPGAPAQGQTAVPQPNSYPQSSPGYPAYSNAPPASSAAASYGAASAYSSTAPYSAAGQTMPTQSAQPAAAGQPNPSQNYYPGQQNNQQQNTYGYGQYAQQGQPPPQAAAPASQYGGAPHIMTKAGPRAGAGAAPPPGATPPAGTAGNPYSRNSAPSGGYTGYGIVAGPAYPQPGFPN